MGNPPQRAALTVKGKSSASTDEKKLLDDACVLTEAVDGVGAANTLRKRNVARERLREQAMTKASELIVGVLSDTSTAAPTNTMLGQNIVYARREASQTAIAVLSACEHLRSLSSAVAMKEAERARLQAELDASRIPRQRATRQPVQEENGSMEHVASHYAKNTVDAACQSNVKTSAKKLCTRELGMDDSALLQQEREQREDAEATLAQLREQQAQRELQQHASVEQAAQTDEDHDRELLREHTTVDTGVQIDEAVCTAESATKTDSTEGIEENCKAVQEDALTEEMHALQQEVETLRKEKERAERKREETQTEMKVLRDALSDALSTHPSVMHDPAMSSSTATHAAPVEMKSKHFPSASHSRRPSNKR